MSIFKTLVWVRLPKFSLYLWEEDFLQSMGNYLGKFIKYDLSEEKNGLFTNVRICVEVDLNKGWIYQIFIECEYLKWT
jgi:hypothetical protein